MVQPRILWWKSVVKFGSDLIFTEDLQWKHWGTERQEQSSPPRKSPTSSPQQIYIDKDISAYKGSEDAFVHLH